METALMLRTGSEDASLLSTLPEATPVPRFWRVLETLPVLADVPVIWQYHLDCEFERTSHLLRATPNTAAAYPRWDAGVRVAPYRVVRHVAGDYVGVPPDGDKPRPLTEEDVRICDIDLARRQS